MSFSDAFFPFSMSGLVYVGLAAQLYMGFPPFYKHRPGQPVFWFKKSNLPWKLRREAESEERELTLLVTMLMPFVIGTMGLMALSAFTQLSVFFLVGGAFAIWGGVRIRRHLRETTNGTLPWVTSFWWVPWPISVRILRYPMLVFDIWTVIWSMAIGALFLLISLHR